MLFLFTKYPKNVKPISFQIFILNLNTIHTGKGMKAAPNALLDDGLLDIILLGPIPIEQVRL